MTIRENYVDAIRGIMAEYGVRSPTQRPAHEVRSDATLEDVLRYTDWYLTATGNDTEHYRFDRYYNAIDQALDDREGQWVHIDIGCGAGPFSWAFMDWATKRGIAPADLSLYGYDPSPEMIRLAWMLRARLCSAVPNYPDLRYESNYTTFVRKLTNIRSRANCLVTMGHVLAGNHNDEDIRAYTRIIEAVATPTADSADVRLLASDATSDTNRSLFGSGFEKLLSSLSGKGLRSQSVPLFTGRTSDRCVVLSRKEA